MDVFSLREKGRLREELLVSHVLLKMPRRYTNWLANALSHDSS